MPGVAEHVATLDDDLVAAVRRLADELEVPLHSVCWPRTPRCWRRCPASTTSSTGYVAGPVRPLPCRLTTEARSWRALLLDTSRVESELLSHRDFPVDELRRELGLTGPSFETVFDPVGSLARRRISTDLAEDTVLWVALATRDGRLVLRLRYRTDVLDAECAARIAGYHLTALALIAADPDAEHERQSLLSAEELRFQLDGLAGPRRELPDRRFHELFEQRVRTHPDAVAAVHGDRQWTYRELNARANRLARALLARGLRREGVVAVVTERNLDWMAAVLAIFKAGGVYLPIEPHFPADRIATTLSRAGCRLVLTELGSTTMLDQALDTLPGVQTLFIERRPTTRAIPTTTSASPSRPTSSPTSTSPPAPPVSPRARCASTRACSTTSTPRSTTCGIGEGQVVAQTAPQCFDISLWQLVSALLVGGRTLLVEQEAILDVERFVDTIVDGRVAVLQVVPSYLEVVLSYLAQHPRELPDLRCVSVTGEALKKELAQRWFAAQPGIKLVNAYGLTETSDDTNHEVMDRVPDRDGFRSGPGQQRARLRRRRAPVTGAARRPW